MDNQLTDKIEMIFKDPRRRKLTIETTGDGFLVTLDGDLVFGETLEKALDKVDELC
jgi:hypothetical protein